MGDKYALRPRSLRQQQMPAAPERGHLASQHHNHHPTLPTPPPTAPPAVTPTAAPGVASMTTTPGGGLISSNGGGARPKQKPAPLSKYRRKTANARERSRMREINVAFETLRRAVPHMTTNGGGGGGGPVGPSGGSPAAACASEKLTKITTLRLAMRYIAALSQAVQAAQREAAAMESHQEPPLFGQPLLPSAAYAPCPSDGALAPTSHPAAPLHPLQHHHHHHHSPVQGQFADPDLLGGDLFSDTPLADLVDPCLTAVALTSDDFYDTPFVTDFS